MPPHNGGGEGSGEGGGEGGGAGGGHGVRIVLLSALCLGPRGARVIVSVCFV